MVGRRLRTTLSLLLRFDEALQLRNDGEVFLAAGGTLGLDQAAEIQD